MTLSRKRNCLRGWGDRTNWFDGANERRRARRQSDGRAGRTYERTNVNRLRRADERAERRERPEGAQGGGRTDRTAGGFDGDLAQRGRRDGGERNDRDNRRMDDARVATVERNGR